MNELTNNTGNTRMPAIDLLRGVVMVLMAIDHVRVYSGIPSWGVTPGIFFTRWVTHFCVPAFVFFAGTSAFLYGVKRNNTAQLTRFLFTRGLFLIILELTLIRFCWTFNFNYADFTLAGVIWMLGCCMILMSLLVRLPRVSIPFIGLGIVFFQHLFAYLPGVLPENWQQHFKWYWEFIYPSGMEEHRGITILYVIVPWIGVMMTGYGFGMLLLTNTARRDKICRSIGYSAIVLFFLLSLITLIYYGDPEDKRPYIYRMLDQRKYPPSLLYLLMTLGPVIAAIPFAARVKGRLGTIFRTFGSVPLFYYLLHIPIIHTAALLVNYLREGRFNGQWYTTAPYTHVPADKHWPLWLLYLVFVCIEILLYFICKSYAGFKKDNPGNRWLKYI